jgi:hypothetical protein
VRWLRGSRLPWHRHLAGPRSARRTGYGETSHAPKTHRSVDVGFRLADRDKRVAAGVLAGGVAYRMFFWVLSVSVLSTGALGVADGAWLDETLRELGLRPTAVDAIAELLKGSDNAQWWFILVGGWLVLWTGYLGAKALVLVHAAVWGVPPPPAQRQWAMSLVFSGTAVAFMVSMSLADSVQARVAAWGSSPSWCRPPSRSPVAGGVQPAPALRRRMEAPRSRCAPGGDRRPSGTAARGLVPRARAGQCGRELYGLLGIVATALFGFYLLARLILVAPPLNASVGEERSAAARHPDGRTHP